MVDLKNGVKLTQASVTASANDAAGTVKFVPDPSKSLPDAMGVAVMSSSSMVDINMQAMVAAFQGSGLATVSGVPAADMAQIDVRFMQFAWVNYYTVTYAGKRSSEGMVDYAYTGNLTGKWMLDCLTNTQATAAVNRPFYNNETTARQLPSLYPTINDTPRANVALNLYNGKTFRENFLWLFESSTLFAAYMVFKHKSGEIEPIEGCTWQLDRELELRWKDAKPSAKTFKSTLTVKSKNVKPDKSPVLAGLCADSSKLEIINVASNAALGQMRSTPGSIRFDEMDKWWDGFADDFWT